VAQIRLQRGVVIVVIRLAYLANGAWFWHVSSVACGPGWDSVAQNKEPPAPGQSGPRVACGRAVWSLG